MFAALASESSGSRENFASFDVPIWVWFAFLALISVLLIVDLLPPSPRDPFGIHKAISRALQPAPAVMKLFPRILARADAGTFLTASLCRSVHDTFHVLKSPLAARCARAAPPLVRQPPLFSFAPSSPIRGGAGGARRS